MSEERLQARIFELLHRLDAASIHYELGRFRDDAIAILVTVPGERWEIEFMKNGAIEVERFRSTGEILDEESLTDLFARFSDTG